MTILVRGAQSDLAYGMVILKLIHKLKIDTWNKKPKRQKITKRLNRYALQNIRYEYRADFNTWMKKDG